MHAQRKSFFFFFNAKSERIILIVYTYARMSLLSHFKVDDEVNVYVHVGIKVTFFFATQILRKFFFFFNTK